LLLVQVADYSMSRNLGTAHVVTYVPGSKGAPSFCRIYRYPNFEENQAALSNRNRRLP
jgi:translation initiation factor 2A